MLEGFLSVLGHTVLLSIIMARPLRKRKIAKEKEKGEELGGRSVDAPLDMAGARAGEAGLLLRDSAIVTLGNWEREGISLELSLTRKEKSVDS